MKSSHAVVLVLLLAIVAGLGAWFAFGQNGDDAPPSAQPTAPAPLSPRADAARANPERSAVATAPDHVPEPSHETPVPDEPQPAAAPTANVRLFVRSATTKQPLAAFRWRARSEDLGAKHGDGTDGRADLVLPAGSHIELLLEADGFAPHTASPVVPGPNEPALDVEVFLVPTAVATGITLNVHDASLQPITDVRVDAFSLRADNRELAWHLEKPLWIRRTAAADGHYVLPELAPGEYGLRVFATDKDGEVQPMVPFVHTYALTGSNGFVEDVTLEPGCLLLLELLDASGRPLDPSHGAVTLGLHLPGGPMIPRNWLQKTEKGMVRSLDSLPGVGVAWPGEPVAAGTWQLDVLVDGQPALQRQLVLRAGERQQERIVVP